MQSTNDVFSLSPFEDNYEYLTAPYEFKSVEYSDAYMFHQILGSRDWKCLNYSDIFEDYVLHGGVPESWWTIFFNARPSDADKLASIARRLPNAKQGVVVLDVLPWG